MARLGSWFLGAMNGTSHAQQVRDYRNETADDFAEEAIINGDGTLSLRPGFDPLGARWKIRVRSGIKQRIARLVHREHLLSDKPSIVVKHPTSSELHFSQKSAFPLLFRPFPCPMSSFSPSLGRPFP